MRRRPGLDGRRSHTQDLVFPSAVGTPFDGGNMLRDTHYPLLARAGLPRVRFHDLRARWLTATKSFYSLLRRAALPKVRFTIYGTRPQRCCSKLVCTRT